MSQQSLIAVNIVNYSAMGPKNLRVVADLCFTCLNYLACFAVLAFSTSSFQTSRLVEASMTLSWLAL
jgi:hypothetical protein